MKFDFAFGHSYAVAKAAEKAFKWHATSVSDFTPTYPPFHNEDILTRRTRALIESLTGREYEHVLITYGATGALNLLLRDMAVEFTAGVYTDDLYFPYYPKMFSRAGLTEVNKDLFKVATNAMQLTALPTNPTGEMDLLIDSSSERTIWDACYYNPVYVNKLIANTSYIPKHKVMVGSYGKLFGVNGLRLGWIATDDTEMFKRLEVAHIVETMGVCTLSQKLVNNLFAYHFYDKFESFYREARESLNNNRTEMQRLEYLLDRQVPKNGMFWFSPMDGAALRLLNKSEVDFIDGRKCGATYDSIRLSLGQTNQLTKEMVDTVLKKDHK